MCDKDKKNTEVPRPGDGDNYFVIDEDASVEAIYNVLKDLQDALKEEKEKEKDEKEKDAD